MIIDTERLKRAVGDYEERIARERGIDWDTCSESYLRQAINRLAAIEQVEWLLLSNEPGNVVVDYNSIATINEGGVHGTE